MVETSRKPASLHVVIYGFQRDGADFNGSVLLDEDGVARKITMNNSTIAVPAKTSAAYLLSTPQCNIGAI